MPAASRPSISFTIDHFCAFLTRSLITKTGEAPSSVNRHVRTLYALAKPFDVDWPGHLEALIRRIDLLERNHPTAWYIAQARKEIQLFRHELERAARAQAMPQPPRRVPAASAAEVQHTAEHISAVLLGLR